MWQPEDGFFQDETRRLGRSVTSRVLSLKLEPLPRWAVGALELPEGAEGVILERVRAVDGQVALYCINYLPEAFASVALALEDPNESLYSRLKELAGVEIARARRTLVAVLAGERLSALLEVEPSAPIVAIESVTWDRGHRPFDCFRSWVRTDRLAIEVEAGQAACMSYKPTTRTEQEEPVLQPSLEVP
jgi:GntR family transcriptional regulator